MPTYAFKGRNRLNELIAGEREAASQDELRALLRREQIILTSATEKGREIAIPKLGRRKKVDDTVNRMAGRKVVVRAAAATPRQIDGDPVGAGNELICECLHGKLLVRVPR